MNRLKEIGALFFKLGCFAFGGPAAHIAMLNDEVVEKRRWMSKQHFLDLVGATNLVPGPNSTEMTMHCGYERGGVKGLFVAGICFIFPAALSTLILAWFYIEYGEEPNIKPFFEGIKPAVLAVIAGAIFKLGKKAIKNNMLIILGLIVILVSFLRFNEIVALLLAGILGAIFFTWKDKALMSFEMATFLSLIGLAKSPSLLSTSIFLKFLKVGSILYGSGYVLFAYLDTELVQSGLLTRQELLDAVAMGQFTPGPVLSTATFIGYQLGGFSGAVWATIGIFLPSFLFVWLLNPLISKMQKSIFLRNFLDSVNIAAVAIMAVVLIRMSVDTFTSWQNVLIATLGFVFYFGVKKINAIWIIIGGAILGYLLNMI